MSNSYRPERPQIVFHVRDMTSEILHDPLSIFAVSKVRLDVEFDDDCLSGQ